MTTLRYDLHLHTEYSPDCDTGLDSIEPHAHRRGLTGLAVTDHNTIEGALRLRDRVKSLDVIIAEEVSTLEGDVIGLFLHEQIPPKMSALETIQAIHAQGGLVYLPHPFDKKKARRTRGSSLSAIIDTVDIVETFNGKVGRDRYNLLASEYAARHQKIAAGGSDAHNLRAIGTVVNTFEAPSDLADPAAFLEALATAHITGQRRNPLTGWLVRGRRPLSLAWRRMRNGKR